MIGLPAARFIDYRYECSILPIERSTNRPVPTFRPDFSESADLERKRMTSQVQTLPVAGPRLTDSYVLRYLIQRTNDIVAPLVWREGEQGGCEARSEGIRLELELVHGREGSRWLLTLRHGDRTELAEPFNTAFFGRRYRSEEEREVADSLRSLAQAAQRQIADRPKAAAAREVLKSRVFIGVCCSARRRRSSSSGAEKPGRTKSLT
jgi:hypothetical protein